MRGFWSYARLDDEAGRVSILRKEFENSISASHGERVALFQFTVHNRWGKDWRDGLDKELANADFLIAVLSTSYLKRAHCRYEFEQATRLGKEVFPLYYRTSKLLDDPSARKRQVGSGDPAKAKAARFAASLTRNHWRDFRKLRNKSFDHEEVRNFIDDAADHIVETVDTP